MAASNSEPLGPHGTMVTKRVPSYMRPTRTSMQKQTLGPKFIQNDIEKIKKGNTKQVHRVGSKVTRLSMPSTSSSATIVDDADDGSKTGISLENRSSGKVPVDEEALPVEATSQANHSVVHQGETDDQQTESVILSKPTLGKLFTEGGLERLLIEVLMNISAIDQGSCLKVCKNTNRVIVNTSAIQLDLRFHLYGIGRLPLSEWSRSKLNMAQDQESSKSTRKSSKKLLELLHSIQFQTEHTTYDRLLNNPLSIPHSKLATINGDAMLIEIGTAWTVMEIHKPLTVINRAYANSSLTLTLCSEDKIVVESIGVSNADGNLIAIKFCSIAACAPNGGSTKHPDAVFENVSLFIPPQNLRQSDKLLVITRLYPNGLIAVLVAEPHECSAPLCGGATIPAKRSIRLAVFNWQSGHAFGVIKIPDSTTQIFDVQFLDDIHILCSSCQIDDGVCYPCVDLYEISKPGHPITTPEKMDAALLPSIPLVATLQLPSLKGPKCGCVWTESPASSTRISEFSLLLPVPAISIRDQVMTFRLEGQNEGGKEKLQGVILISGLLNLMRQAVNRTSKAAKTAVDVGTCLGSSTTSSAMADSTNAIHCDPITVKWEQWSSLASIGHSKSATVLQSRNTQVANIARSRVDKTHAMMVIRDYNQQLLRAPVEHMERNLGHPTNNRDPEEKIEVSKPLGDPFENVTEPKVVESILLGDVKYGLGHRKRTIDLGEYRHNTASSRLFWNGRYLVITPHFEERRCELHLFAPVTTAAQVEALESAKLNT